MPKWCVQAGLKLANMVKFVNYSLSHPLVGPTGTPSLHIRKVLNVVNKTQFTFGNER